MFALADVVILVAATFYGGDRDAAPPPIEGSTGQAVEVVAATRDGEAIRYRYKVYPTEIALGAPLCVARKVENLSGEELNVTVEPNGRIYGAQRLGKADRSRT